jgi:hypothetical protein
MAVYAKNLAGANTELRTTFKEHKLAQVEMANDNKLMVYVSAGVPVSGTCTVDMVTGAVTDTAGNWTADAAFVAGEYGWVWKVFTA